MTLNSQLAMLEAVALIRKAQAQPELEYLFRHALAQEAAYETLVKQDRKQLHHAVGEVLERLYPERAAELSPLLANHFYEAADFTRALKYLIQAGDHAARRFANREALLHYARALAIVAPAESADAHGGVESAQLQHLFSAYGRALEMSGDYEAALENYRRMEALARARGDQPLELAALVARGTVHSAPTSYFDPEQAQSLADAALELARALHDRAAEARVLWNIALLHKFSAQWREVVKYGERAAELARALQLREQLAFILNDIHMAYLYSGRTQRARQLLEESRQIWRELGHIPMLADNLAGAAQVEFSAGDLRRAVEYSRESYRLAVSINNLWSQSYALGTLANSLSERGEFDEAIASAEQAVTLGMRADFEVVQVFVHATQALLYGSLGDFARGLAYAQKAIRAADAMFPALRPLPLIIGAMIHTWNDQFARAAAQLQQARDALGPEDQFNFILAAVAEGELLLASGAYEQALVSTSEHVERAREADVRGFLAWLLCLKGEALLKLERWDEAHEALVVARDAIESHGSRRTLWRVLLAQSEVEAQLGHADAAQRLRSEARETIAYIAAHISSPELRDTFLRRRGVRELGQAR